MKAHERRALAALKAGDTQQAEQHITKRFVRLTKHHTARATSPFISVLHATIIAEHLGAVPPEYLEADLSTPGVVTLTRVLAWRELDAASASE